MSRTLLSSLALAGLIVMVSMTQAQTPVDPNINAKIRQEGMERSQILRTMHFLTDIYGPRLTGSPNQENAAKWAAHRQHKPPLPRSPVEMSGMSHQLRYVLMFRTEVFWGTQSG